MYSRTTSLRKTISLLLEETVVMAMGRSFQEKTRRRGRVLSSEAGTFARTGVNALSAEAGQFSQTESKISCSVERSVRGPASRLRCAAPPEAEVRDGGRGRPAVPPAAIGIPLQIGAAEIDLPLDAGATRAAGFVALAAQELLAVLR